MIENVIVVDNTQIPADRLIPGNSIIFEIKEADRYEQNEQKQTGVV
jgi:hypothetical protein